MFAMFAFIITDCMSNIVDIKKKHDLVLIAPKAKILLEKCILFKGVNHTAFSENHELALSQ